VSERLRVRVIRRCPPLFFKRDFLKKAETPLFPALFDELVYAFFRKFPPSNDVPDADEFTSEMLQICFSE